MLIRVRKSWELGDRAVTPEPVYHNRRQIIRTLGAGAAALAVGACDPMDEARAGDTPTPATGDGTGGLDYVPGPYRTDEPLTAYEAVTSYNNFYEFGTDKSDPARYAHRMKTEPWTVRVEGKCAKPGRYALDDLIKPHRLEERIYRLRCVEAWSMVIPWIGIPLADVIKRLEPTGEAKYVQFETAQDKRAMRGLRWPVLDWPYVEGLRMDEAMHPLTLLAVGVYGRAMPNQNGAPIRLVVPWKYGFKSIKSIVAIRFWPGQPSTAWMKSNPREYGFFSNVNPQVDHPRWSQKTERRIGEFRRRPTLMFNGYAEEVASLYAGMDLKKFH